MSTIAGTEIVERIWARDPTLWTGHDEAEWLGWLDEPGRMLALAAAVVKTSPVPLVIDADALQADIVEAGEATRVLTPHAGEFKRIAGDADLRAFAKRSNNRAPTR